MKALVIKKQGSLNSLELIEAEKPSPREDEVLVAVYAAAINPADLKVTLKLSGSGFVHSSREPVRLGYDFSGVIEERGQAVSDLERGNEV